MTSPTAPAPSRGALLAMEHKYRELVRLRREQDAGVVRAPPRDAMRALASATPGSLREIDVLPFDALEARLTQVQGALAGAEVPAWLAWMIDFHAWLRLALALRSAGAKDVESALEWARARAPDPLDLANERIDAAAVAALLRPENGRVVPVALRLVALAHGKSPSEVERALFPPVLRLRR